MGTQFKRTDRIAEMVQRKLAAIIPQEVKDPRLKGMVTVSAVKVSADLSHAKVYFTVLNEDKDLVGQILNAAASFLRTVLARTSTLRTVPQLHFVYDESIEYGENLSRLIEEANKSQSDDDESN